MNQEKTELLAIARLDRHLDWPKVKRVYLMTHRECAACDKRTKLEVHHKIPFWMDRNLELDVRNLITLCPDDHFMIGHLKSWKSYNPDVEVDAALWKKKIKNKPKWRPKL